MIGKNPDLENLEIDEFEDRSFHKEINFHTN